MLRRFLAEMNEFEPWANIDCWPAKWNAEKPITVLQHYRFIKLILSSIVEEVGHPGWSKSFVAVRDLRDLDQQFSCT